MGPVAVPSQAFHGFQGVFIKAPVVGSPVVGKDGSVYVGCTDGYLRAYDSAGRPTWEFKLQKVASGQLTQVGGVLDSDAVKRVFDEEFRKRVPRIRKQA